MKLYYVPMTRSTRPRWLLEELGVPYELVRLDASKKETRTPEYLKVNPLGHVPALVDGDQVIVESAAIILHLADRFPEKGLAPPLGSSERAQYYQWIVYAMATLEPQVSLYWSHTKRLEESQRVAAVAEAARTRFSDELKLVAVHLDGRQYLVGDRFTAADVVMASVLGWAKGLGLLTEPAPLLRYASELLARPAAKRSRE